MTKHCGIGLANKVVRYVALGFLIMITATFSKIMWLLPLQGLAEDFYNEWLTPQGGNLSFWLLITWFHWGAGKVMAVVLRDQNDEMFGRPAYRLKMWLLVPFAPLMNFHLQRPYFPVPSQ